MSRKAIRFNVMLFPSIERPGQFHRYSGDNCIPTPRPDSLRGWLCRHGVHKVNWKGVQPDWGYCDWCKEEIAR